MVQDVQGRWSSPPSSSMLSNKKMLTMHAPKSNTTLDNVSRAWRVDLQVRPQRKISEGQSHEYVLQKKKNRSHRSGHTLEAMDIQILSPIFVSPCLGKSCWANCTYLSTSLIYAQMEARKGSTNRSDIDSEVTVGNDTDYLVIL